MARPKSFAEQVVECHSVAEAKAKLEQEKKEEQAACWKRKQAKQYAPDRAQLNLLLPLLRDLVATTTPRESLSWQPPDYRFQETGIGMSGFEDLTLQPLIRLAAGRLWTHWEVEITYSPGRWVAFKRYLPLSRKGYHASFSDKGCTHRVYGGTADELMGQLVPKLAPFLEVPDSA